MGRDYEIESDERRFNPFTPRYHLRTRTPKAVGSWWIDAPRDGFTEIAAERFDAKSDTEKRPAGRRGVRERGNE